MRYSLRVVLFILLAVIVVSPAKAADSSIACVQNILNAIGYEVGTDGILGRKTKEAVINYVKATGQYEPLLVSLVENVGTISPNNAAAWCDNLTKFHQEVKLSALTMRKLGALDNRQFWQMKLSKGWQIVFVNLDPEKMPKQLVLSLNGDDSSYEYFSRHCNRFGPMMPIDTVMACVYRPYSWDIDKRRHPKEVNEFTEIFRRLKGIWPSTSFHCAGHSGGGHLCFALAQQKKVSLTCLVTMAPNTADKLRQKLRGDVNIVKRYDPIDYAGATKASDIIILGDNEDPVVDHRVWEAFIEAAALGGVSVRFIETPGTKHHNQSLGMRELKDCIVRNTASN